MPETTANLVRIPVNPRSKEDKIRTISIDSEKGISALYNINRKNIVTYLFDRTKWTMSTARSWISDHKNVKKCRDTLAQELSKMNIDTSYRGLNKVMHDRETEDKIISDIAERAKNGKAQQEEIKTNAKNQLDTKKYIASRDMVDHYDPYQDVPPRQKGPKPAKAEEDETVKRASDTSKEDVDKSDLEEDVPIVPTTQSSGRTKDELWKETLAARERVVNAMKELKAAKGPIAMKSAQRAVDEAKKEHTRIAAMWGAKSDADDEAASKKEAFEMRYGKKDEKDEKKEEKTTKGGPGSGRHADGARGRWPSLSGSDRTSLYAAHMSKPNIKGQKLLPLRYRVAAYEAHQAGAKTFSEVLDHVQARMNVKKYGPGEVSEVGNIQTAGAKKKPTEMKTPPSVEPYLWELGARKFVEFLDEEIQKIDVNAAPGGEGSQGCGHFGDDKTPKKSAKEAKDASLVGEKHEVNKSIDQDVYREAIKEQFKFDIGTKPFQGNVEGKAADHNISDYDMKQLLAGIAVEEEHTDDIAVAIRIAMDHLEEIPDYYDRLAEMEESTEKGGPGSGRHKEGGSQYREQHGAEAAREGYVDYHTSQGDLKGALASAWKDIAARQGKVPSSNAGAGEGKILSSKERAHVIAQHLYSKKFDELTDLEKLFIEEIEKNARMGKSEDPTDLQKGGVGSGKYAVGENSHGFGLVKRLHNLHNQAIDAHQSLSYEIHTMNSSDPTYAEKVSSALQLRDRISMIRKKLRDVEIRYSRPAEGEVK